MNLRIIFPLLLALGASLVANTAHASEGVVLTLESRRWFSSARHHVQVPVELNQVVLERQEGSGWRPLRTWHLRGVTSLPLRRLAISLPRGVNAEEVRVVAYRNNKFPFNFTRGRRIFQPRMVSADSAGDIVRGISGTTLMSGAEAVATLNTSSSLSAGETVRVVESDIWQMAGDTLFFFNQYRGLQVLDLTDPAQPRRTGTLRLPASGEQMFVLSSDGSALALLGRSSRRESAGEFCLFLVSVKDGVPTLEAELPIGGYVLDSRLVVDEVLGTRLHVLAQSWGYDEMLTDAVSPVSLINHSWDRWGPRARLHTFDLTSLQNAAALPVVVVPGHANYLQAAEGHLLVGGYSWETREPRLHILAMRAGAEPVLMKTVHPAGAIQDKFKTSIVNGAACTVSVSTRSGRRETWVETFSLTDSNVTPMAALELPGARGETLYATRFDGSRLYVVTFLQVDPLFVVDLSDPAAPVEQGILEIPGWSTYLEPMGDRLLAVGVEDGRVTASLFDVADPAMPTMLSRISLGEPGMSSWSEAHYDEKAVCFDAENQLLLVPYEQWTQGGTRSAVEVIRVSREGLAAVQSIPHGNRARRGSLVGEHFITFSGKELHATPRAGGETVRLTLAWSVDRVLALDGYLVQVEDGQYGWGNGVNLPSSEGSPATRSLIVSGEGDPDAILAEIEIEDAPIIGMKMLEGRLYLAQWIASADGASGSVRTWVLDVTHLPDLVPLATLEQRVDLPGWALDFSKTQALMPREDLLVWQLSTYTSGYHWWWPQIMHAPSTTGTILPAFSIHATMLTTTARLIRPISDGGPDVAKSFGIFCPISLGAQVAALSPVILKTEQHLHEMGRTMAEGGFIFVSQDESFGTAQYAARSRIVSQLHVLDCRSNDILVRQPLRLPGRLLSLHRADAQGAILLTEAERNDKTQTRLVQATAYDGVLVWQLHELRLDMPVWTPETTDGTRLFFARNAATPGVVSVQYDAGTGHLIQGGVWHTVAAPTELYVVNHLLMSASHGSLELATFGENGFEPHAHGYETPVNLWPRLDRAEVGTHGLWLPVREYGVEFLPWHELAP